MIVVDACVLVEYLLQTPLGDRVHARLRLGEPEWHVPHLVDVEIAQALRRLVRRGDVAPARAREALGDLLDLDLHRHPHTGLLARVWTLRDNVTAYDAMYLALAEALDAVLVTCDEPLASAAGHRARVELIR